MPRTAKGARLWLEPEERDADGRLVRRSTWVIRDGSRKVRTGCVATNREGAEQALAEYIAAKYQVSRDRGRHPSQILVLDVMNIYLTDVVAKQADPSISTGRIMTLADWWNGKTLADVNGEACRAYVAHRVMQPRKASRPEKTGNAPRMVTAAGARRELEDLRSAINHHRKEGYCSEIVSVALPDRGLSREDWLTRSEAAALLWGAWRAKQRFNGSDTKRDVGKHIARFILVGLYTGTRHAAICGAALKPAIGRGHVDLDRGIFYRRAQGTKETKKRQPPARLADRLLAHLRRWERLGIARHAIVEWNGKPVGSVRKGFAAAVAAAGIESARNVTPHILRHTAATWAMQNGADVYAAAGFLGMTVEVLQRVYGHHHPDFQADVAQKVAGQKRDRYPVNKSGQSRTNATKMINISKVK
jgi:integrase